ncbi:hypothetical protein [Streptococcus himalayensis]|uniref:Uncharacterized protein n=1 Tax=Streptococcus himalayensis TaxID=1888195 RepID=A0A917A573_9STRE|nr:hypothetical protein [Streptococcus himalayensis]GGE25665.1 hypothetical protein GCM10011510_03470 [Streptococcus himalayensis]
MKNKTLVTRLALIGQVLTVAVVLYNLGYLFGEYLAGVKLSQLSWGALLISILLAGIVFVVRMGGRKR